MKIERLLAMTILLLNRKKMVTIQPILKKESDFESENLLI